uniref:Nucleolus and neural progenitor protein n=1 Tax=Fundulus heteroclitus TaxID=8078 RepID=A0A3Q2P281_FUNHE
MAAGELWNRVNIPYPCATSAVKIQLASRTAIQVENDEVLTLLHNKILQTEIRVLYELMYILNNSYRGNKTFKGLQRVEQCINRLKNMKLDAALQELVELCPNQIQMALCEETGECDVPSQPILEWTCLKVLGAGKLLSCTLSRCSDAFLLANQQMKWEEFLVLNLVLTSMLSRLWVIFRGLLVSLSKLYQWLLKLLEDVAQAQPMPYLTDVVLPAGMAEFLGPADALVLKSHPAFHARLKDQKIFVNFYLPNDYLILIPKSKFVSEGLRNDAKKQKFKKQAEEAPTFTLMSANLEEMIQWCRSEGMKKTKRLLAFLRLKCQKMKCLEAEGYNVQRKLRGFRQEVCLALSPQGSAGRTFGFPATTARGVGRRTRFQSLRKRFIGSRNRTGVKTKGRRKENKQQIYFKDVQKSRTASMAGLQTTNSGSKDDIDDIFAPESYGVRKAFVF